VDLPERPVLWAKPDSKDWLEAKDPRENQVDLDFLDLQVLQETEDHRETSLKSSDLSDLPDLWAIVEHRVCLDWMERRENAGTLVSRVPPVFQERMDLTGSVALRETEVSQVPQVETVFQDGPVQLDLPDHPEQWWRAKRSPDHLDPRGWTVHPESLDFLDPKENVEPVETKGSGENRVCPENEDLLDQLERRVGKVTRVYQDKTETKENLDSSAKQDLPAFKVRQA